MHFFTSSKKVPKPFLEKKFSQILKMALKQFYRSRLLTKLYLKLGLTMKKMGKL